MANKKRKGEVYDLPFFIQSNSSKSNAYTLNDGGESYSVPVWCQRIIKTQGLIMSATKAKYPFRIAVLADRKGDISKAWYVNYYVWSEQKGELVRKRGVFDQVTAKERYKESADFIKVINEALEGGLIIDEISSPDSEISKTTSLIKAIEFFRNNKKKTVTENTYKAYKRDLKVFEDWVNSQGLGNSQIQYFGTTQAFAFSDYLDSYINPVTEKSYSKKTYSNFITTLRTMWTIFTVREILKTNPFLKVVKRKGRSGHHIPYSSEQVKIFKKECLENIKDEQLWLFVNFIYYGFFRPAEEAQQLQVKHILAKTIVVPSSIAKNDLTEFIRIPKPLEELITKFNIRNYPPNHYVFSKSGKPGPKRLGKEYMYTHNRKVLLSAKLTDQDYDLYGWKHTGAIALYLATKDIKLVQVQCRHKDINTTDKYLRDLGMFLDEDALDLFPVAGL